jgi:exonuclease III
MKSRFLESSDVYLTIFIIVLSFILFFSTQCSSVNIRSASNSEINMTGEESIGSSQVDKEELSKKKTIKILTQNTMLIPLSFVAPAFNERTDCVIDLILEDYGIVCLQEVFNGSSQNRIISSWNDMICHNVNYEGFSQWQADYFNNWYNSLPEQDKNMWHPIVEAQSTAVLSNNKNFWGVKVLDRRTNTIEAKLVCSPYYAMGPDNGRINIKQDSGLIILSKYPIIECSAMTYSKNSGTDKLANKGVLYARIQIGSSKEDYIHIFNTHIQSHDYSETRLAQIGELMDFISEIIKSDKDYIRPILVSGDFNVTAEKPDNWMALADVNPPETENANNSDYLDEETREYVKFKEIVEDFPSNHLNTPHQIYLIDSWQDLNPKDPGFTWIGKDWIIGSKNSYGDIGNQVAIEDGGPQRIDYIFYFKGTDNLYIKPISISLVPNRPDLLYCFDKRLKENGDLSSYGYEKVSLESDCSYKSYTVSDHLGLELNFEIGINN